jgi:uroporphyrinogen-III synthase
MKVLVTRPATQADEWVLELRAKGIDAAALPLIGITPAINTMPVVLAWVQLAKRTLAVFVSPNAAEQFFALKPPGMFWPATTYAGSTGPGTSRMLLKLGVPRDRLIEPAPDAAQFDSESLWARLETLDVDWQGAGVLLVRGDGGREWLAEQLAGRGAQVAKLVAYHTTAPKFNKTQRSLLNAALAFPQHHLWLFSSSEAVTHLAAAVTFGNWGKAWALTTHPRIAARAQELGFSNVVQTRPAIEAVAACIQSFAT